MDAQLYQIDRHPGQGPTDSTDGDAAGEIEGQRSDDRRGHQGSIGRRVQLGWQVALLDPAASEPTASEVVAQQGRSWPEIAQATGEARATLRMLHARALTRLRQELASEG